MKQIWAVTRKELSAYFGSPMALIFVGAFLVVTLFVFFWVETFFARGVADVRALFRWMPVLILFLVAALTMRQWSEEQRTGTLEVLLTLPVNRVQLVVGKFLGVMILVALALALTLFLPITVSIIGDLDWGPVVGGYLAALLLAGAYAAIGLFVSSRTDNQIVSLIATVFLGGLFYVLGTQGLTGHVPAPLADILRAVGTGSRFESIERGVVDLRDLAYYLSLAAVFLALNVLSLDAKRWSRGAHTTAYRRQAILTVALVVANLVALNAWLFRAGGLRADLTADRQYSLSPATRNLIAGLQEPLLIRGYFSEETHPLLAPLVPAIRDMLEEYRVASNGKIQVEVLDPRDNPELEAEANQVYGINPTPFQVSGRYESSVINSYFDLLVRYGDQHTTLGFGDLIEVEPNASGQIDVRLRNLEYDLTGAIKKAAYGFQSLDSALASIQQPIQLTAYITPQTLPGDLAQVPQTIETVAQKLAEESGGKFSYQVVDPDASSSPVSRETLYNTYGLRPIAASLFSPETYYLHLVLQIGDEAQLLYPAGQMTEADIRTELESAIKRSAPGFLKTVGLWLPDLQPQQDIYGNMAQPLSSWQMLQEQLRQNHTVKEVALSTGRVPADIDVLLVVAAQGMDDKARYAVDQYLMRGGAVIAAGGSFALSQQQMPGGLTVDLLSGGLNEMLAGYGVTTAETMVLDPQNEPFPVQVQRAVAGMQVAEIQQLPYPYFVDVRRDGMDKDSPIVSSLSAVTLQWVSPLTVDETKNAGREVSVLLHSTDQSWVRSATDVQPNPDQYPEYGFPVEGEQKSWPLAVAIRGSFPSFFQGKESPLAATPTPSPEGEPAEQPTAEPALGTIETSPESTRLVVIASSEFVDDIVLQLSQSLSADRYLANLQLVQNAVDWSVEDQDLLTIRTRGTYARLLKPMSQGQETVWEGVNYGLALLALGAIAVVWSVRRRKEKPMELVAEGQEADVPPPGSNGETLPSQAEGGSHE